MNTSIIVLFFLIALISLNIWNTLTLKDLKKRSFHNVDLNDAKYWELKYKQEYMVTVFSVILAIAAFLGYSTIGNVKDDIQKDLQTRLDSSKNQIQQLDRTYKLSQSAIDAKLENDDSLLIQYRNLLIELTERTRLQKRSVLISDKQLINLKTRINEINSKNIIQQNIYIVDDITVERKYFENDYKPKKILYSDLTTISGDKLPIFNKSPFILVFSNVGATYKVENVTTTSFELYLNSTSGTSSSENKATVFITTNP